MLQVEAFPMVALQNKLNGRRERARVEGIENVNPLLDVETTNLRQANAYQKPEQIKQKDQNALATENSLLLMKVNQQEDYVKSMDKENQRLKEENSLLQRTSSELQSQNQVLERQVESKADEVSALQKELIRIQLDANIKIRAMEQHSANLQSELNLVRSQRAQVEQRVLTMTRNLSQGKNVVEKLTGELMSKISAQERMINSQRDKFDMASMSCRITKDEIARTKDKGLRAKERIRDLEAIVNEKNRDREILNRRNKEVSAKLEKSEAEKTDADKEVAKLQEQVQSLEVHQSLLSHKLTLTESIQSEMDEIHKRKVHDLEMKCMKLEAQCESLHKDIWHKEDELEQMKQVIMSGLLGLGQEIGKIGLAFGNQLEQLQTRMLMCVRGHKILREEIEAVRSKNRALTLENNDLMMGITRIGEDFDKLELKFEERIEHILSRISLCFEGKQTLKQGLEEVTSKNKKLQFENHALVMGMTSLNEGFKKLEFAFLEQIEDVHYKISKCCEGNQILEEGLKTVTSRKKELEVENHELIAQVDSLNEGVDTLELAFKAQIERLDARISSCIEANLILQHGLEVLTSKKKVLELENYELRTKVTCLNEGFKNLQLAFGEQIEHLDIQISKCYRDNQIIKEGLEVMTDRKHELELQNRKLMLGVMIISEDFQRLELACQAQMEFALLRINKCFKGHQMVKDWAEAMKSQKNVLELENQELMVRSLYLGGNISVLKEQNSSLEQQLKAKEQEEKRLNTITMDYREKEERLREMAAKQKEEYQDKILELEKTMKEMEEDAARKDDEKRQAIMQLCMQIEYYRDKYNHLVEKISAPLW